MPPYIHVDVESLRRMIEVEELTQEQAAARLGVGSSTIHNRCRQWSIRCSKVCRRINEHGYIQIAVGRGHHLSTSNGYALEHRLMMEKTIGRRLEKGEVVHHVNEIRSDNRSENLVLMPTSDHTRLHNPKGDPVHRLRGACGMSVDEVLAALHGDRELPRPRTYPSIDKRAKDIRAACIALELSLPSWFTNHYTAEIRTQLLREYRSKERLQYAKRKAKKR